VTCENPATTASPHRLSSKDLFGQATRIRIAHGDTEYLLQITRQGKLILTK
jgi:hemin uptake protein HemP